MEGKGEEAMFFPQTVYCWGSQCCLKCVSGLGCCVRLPGLVLLLSPVLSPSLSFSCLPACLRSGDALVCGLGLVLLLSPNLSPIWAGLLRSLVSGLVSQQVSGLGCCVRLLGLVLFLSPVLSPSFLAFGLVMLCPSCLALISQLVSHLGWGAASASLVSSWSCLRLLLCLNLSPVWDAVPWSCLALVSGLVSQLASGLACSVRLPVLFSPVLSPNKSPVWDAVSASLVLSSLVD